MLETLNQLDTSLLLAINGWRSAWADYFMYTFSGKLVWVPMYAAILYVIVRNFSWRVALGCVIAVALTILFADQMCSHVIRPVVCRVRPTHPENPLSEVIQVVNGYRSGHYGFPSCHAANTFGLALFMWLLFRRKAVTLFFLTWALVTSYSRSYLGVHYPGDLLVGAVVGCIGACLCYALFQKFCRYRRPRRFVHPLAPLLVGGITIVGIALYAMV